MGWSLVTKTPAAYPAHVCSIELVLIPHFVFWCYNHGWLISKCYCVLSADLHELALFSHNCPSNSMSREGGLEDLLGECLRWSATCYVDVAPNICSSLLRCFTTSHHLVIAIDPWMLTHAEVLSLWVDWSALLHHQPSSPGESAQEELMAWGVHSPWHPLLFLFGHWGKYAA